MKIRYVGPDDARDLAVDGGLIPCQRMQWIDVHAFAEQHGLDVAAVTDTAKRAVKSDDWELESAKKAARARKSAKKAAPPVEEPVEPDVADGADGLQTVDDVVTNEHEES